jgi:hypothetical protein
MVTLSFSAFRIFLPRGFSLERNGGARVLLSTPARKYLQPREFFEKREPRSRDPYRRRGSSLVSRRQLLAKADMASSRVAA